MDTNINIGLTDERRQGVVLILNTLLADEYLLYTKTRNYHWNVVGRQFNDLHKFFETQYDMLQDIVDDVAERARSLGGSAIGTLSEFLKQSRLAEHPGEYPLANEMLAISWPIMKRRYAVCGRTLKPALRCIMTWAPMTF